MRPTGWPEEFLDSVWEGRLSMDLMSAELLSQRVVSEDVLDNVGVVGRCSSLAVPEGETGTILLTGNVSPRCDECPVVAGCCCRTLLCMFRCERRRPPKEASLECARDLMLAEESTLPAGDAVKVRQCSRRAKGGLLMVVRGATAIWVYVRNMCSSSVMCRRRLVASSWRSLTRLCVVVAEGR
ncbi:hypothetical protein EJ03DRAFT_80282 [Teratosphaeria nubilosa]|uniref:Uncharacterized protein n=1 Tax=Teratosphaeria nubilosa TaxID=161662 RepID=A0A6G1LC13_9PEZI|nr:hypothetical protein EJ03DRAFT_80282 [Teratosphaeria nubilosa]